MDKFGNMETKRNKLKHILENDLDGKLSIAELIRLAGGRVSSSTIYNIINNSTQGNARTQGWITEAINKFLKMTGESHSFKRKDIFPDGTNSSPVI